MDIDGAAETDELGLARPGEGPPRVVAAGQSGVVAGSASTSAARSASRSRSDLALVAAASCSVRSVISLAACSSEAVRATRSRYLWLSARVEDRPLTHDPVAERKRQFRIAYWCHGAGRHRSSPRKARWLRLRPQHCYRP